MLIKKVPPNPCFKKTANGGKKIFKRIVRIDIIIFFGERKFSELQGEQES